mmetsp:Transcript_39504/g.64035  ORF Transcript_39504/g.64035 Transcript_39504/m.64035 type:complete len:231 (-) Transcript_39504:2179-2871(-)
MSSSVTTPLVHLQTLPASPHPFRARVFAPFRWRDNDGKDCDGRLIEGRDPNAMPRLLSPIWYLKGRTRRRNGERRLKPKTKRTPSNNNRKKVPAPHHLPLVHHPPLPPPAVTPQRPAGPLAYRFVPRPTALPPAPLSPPPRPVNHHNHRHLHHQQVHLLLFPLASPDASPPPPPHLALHWYHRGADPPQPWPTSPALRHCFVPSNSPQRAPPHLLLRHHHYSRTVPLLLR